LLVIFAPAVPAPEPEQSRFFGRLWSRERGMQFANAYAPDVSMRAASAPNLGNQGTGFGVMLMSETQTILPFRFPVAVVMQRNQPRPEPWSVATWNVIGVLPGSAVGEGEQERTLIRSEGGAEQVLWAGLNVVLHKEDLESYRYNLEASSPSLFVLCRADGEDMVPVTATVNYDEVGRCNESEDTAFAVPMPPELYQWLERYVVENYVPQEPRKRKKEKWAEQPHFDRRSPEDNG
jgi:hypothetical protein